MNPLRAIKSVTFLQNIQHIRIRNVRKMYGPISNFISYQNKANVVPLKVDYLIRIAARSQTLTPSQCLLCSRIDGFGGREAPNISKYPPNARDKVSGVTPRAGNDSMRSRDQQQSAVNTRGE